MEAMFIVAVFIPSLFQIELIFDFRVYHMVLSMATLWLLFYIGKNMWDMKSGSRSSEFTFHNVFIILVLGYISFENTVINVHFLESPVFFILIFILVMSHFSVMIGNLVMNYGTGTKFNQISLNTLLVSSFIVGLYSAIFFFPLGDI